MAEGIRREKIGEEQREKERRKEKGRTNNRKNPKGREKNTEKWEQNLHTLDDITNENGKVRLK